MMHGQTQIKFTIQLCNNLQIVGHFVRLYLSMQLIQFLINCGTQLVIPRYKHRPIVFDTGVLRKVFGPKRKAVAAGKFVPVRSVKVYKGNRGIIKVVARWNVSGHLHTPAVLLARKQSC